MDISLASDVHATTSRGGVGAGAPCGSVEDAEQGEARESGEGGAGGSSKISIVYWASGHLE